jgi:hypothetical protein
MMIKTVLPDNESGARLWPDFRKSHHGPPARPIVAHSRKFDLAQRLKKTGDTAMEGGA